MRPFPRTRRLDKSRDLPRGADTSFLLQALQFIIHKVLDHGDKRAPRYGNVPLGNSSDRKYLDLVREGDKLLT